MADIFFDGWDGLVRTLISAPVMYAAIIASIRISGKRATSQMNNFDWVVTVAIGSITASGIILDNVTVLEALLAVAILLTLQWGVTYAVPRVDAVRRAVKAEPKLLVHEGRFLRDAMLAERVTADEIRAALRESGLTDVDEAQWVILETDATFSVIPKGDRKFDGVTLEGVAGFPDKEAA